jgi:hypothetical protein
MLNDCLCLNLTKTYPESPLQKLDFIILLTIPQYMNVSP